MQQKIYCSQCHKSAFCDVGRAERKQRRLYCYHHQCYLPTDAKIGACPYVIYENRELYLKGVWKPATYNPYRCSTKST